MVLCKGGGFLSGIGQDSLSVFSQKMSFWPEASSLRVRDVQRQVVWTHTSRQHTLQHPYAPKSAIFHQSSATNGHVLSKLSFLAKGYQFGAQISVYWVWVVRWCPRYPILRALDSKEDVLHAIEAISHLFQGNRHQKKKFLAQKMAKDTDFGPKTVLPETGWSILAPRTLFSGCWTQKHICCMPVRPIIMCFRDTSTKKNIFLPETDKKAIFRPETAPPPKWVYCCPKKA